MDVGSTIDAVPTGPTTCRCDPVVIKKITVKERRPGARVPVGIGAGSLSVAPAGGGASWGWAFLTVVVVSVPVVLVAVASVGVVSVAVVAVGVVSVAVVPVALGVGLVRRGGLDVVLSRLRETLAFGK